MCRSRGAGPWRGAIYGVLALVPVLALGWWRETGLTRLGRREALPYLAPPLLAGAAFFGVGPTALYDGAAVLE